MKKPIKKLSILKSLTILTITLSLLISSSVLASSQFSQTSIILHVNSSIFDPHTNLYIAEVMTENGDIYTIQSFDNISNKWLDATINNSGEILNYKIMEDN